VESKEWKVESGEWRVESGKWRVERGEWKMESGEWKVESGKWREAYKKKQLNSYFEHCSIMQCPSSITDHAITPKERPRDRKREYYMQ
jgi:uncharacterized cupin superfamily protein